MKNNIQNSFESGSFYYDDFTEIQSLTGARLMSFFEQNFSKKSNNFTRAIDLGCGTGEFSKKVLKKVPINELLLLDFSKNMLKISKKKINKKIKVSNVNFDTFNNFENFDLVYSNMSLHWSNNIEVLIKKIFLKLKSNAVFFFSFPNDESFKELKKIYETNNKVYNLNLLPVHKNILDLFDIDLCEIKDEEVNFSKAYDTPLHFLKELKLIGAGASKNLKRNSIFFLKSIKSKININYKTSLFYIKKK